MTVVTRWKSLESKEKIFLAFLSYAVLSFVISVIIFLLFREMEKTEKRTRRFNTLYVNILHTMRDGDDFLIHGLTDDTFYKTGSSPQLIAHFHKLNAVLESIEEINNQGDEVRSLVMEAHLRSMASILVDYQDSFHEFTDLLRDKGYHGHGLDGAMAEISKRISAYSKGRSKNIDDLDRLSHSYRLTNDMDYVIAMQKSSLEAIEEIRQSDASRSEQDLLFMLEEYLDVFEQIVQIDLLTGYKHGTGLEYRIRVAKSVVNELATEINKVALLRQTQVINQLRVVVVVVVTISIILALFLSVGLRYLVLQDKVVN